MAIAVEAAMTRKRIIWGAPVFDQVRVGWNETKRACRSVAQFNSSTMTARFPGGGQIVYRSLDNPDNARGHTADGVVIDECQDVQPAAWYEVLRPMLIDTNGWTWAIGTPKGLNWFHTEHARAREAEDSTAWQSPTLGARITAAGLERVPHPLENPDIPFRELINLYETMPQATFRQEILCEFLQGEGAVFRNIEANLTAPLDAAPARHAGHRIVIGVDWAQKNDFTVLCVFCSTCMIEVALDRFNKIEFAFQRGRLRRLYDDWKVSLVLAEENSIGAPNIEALTSEGLCVQGFQTTAQSKPPLIQSLALALERGEARWLAHPVATAELTAYESSVNSFTGRISYGAPAGSHDDTIIARALALKAALQSGGEVEHGSPLW